MRGRRKSYAYFFILPGCLILLMFTILAAALAFGFSFMDFNLLRPKDAAFVGFENYIRLFQDASFFKGNEKYTVFCSYCSSLSGYTGIWSGTFST